MILAGDIGGTNTRLALFEPQGGGQLALCHRAEAKNAGGRSFDQIVRDFLEPLQLPQRPRVACFGVAGPVKAGRVTLTNLNWTLDEKQLAESLKLPKVALVNDLVAHAAGTNVLRPQDRTTLREGTAVENGNRAIVAPGTGLGEAGIVYDERTRDHRAFPSEGGHCDFAPRDAREVALMQHVRTRTGRCSWEDLLSGPGLKNVWQFVTSAGEFHVDGALKTDDPAPADITAAANDGSCPACVAAVELFTELVGAEAGNLALKFLATGGLYIGGGIAPRILKFIQRPVVIEAFSNKGPKNIQQLLRAIPIHVITSSDNALYGAGHYAEHL